MTLLGFVRGVLTAAGFILLPLASLVAQNATATPAPAILATATPRPSPLPVSPSPLPTVDLGVQLEARERANVRAAPSVDSQLLGEIVVGERYPILGRFFNWLQLEYRFGAAWVFQELVTVHGDLSEIAEVDLSLPTNTPSPLRSGGQDVNTQPTVTDDDAASQNARANRLGNTGNSEISVLPTYTYSPQFTNQNRVSEPSETPDDPRPTTAASVLLSDIPPILPILVLAGLGVLGLLIATIRR